jgi:hypothetical protein
MRSRTITSACTQMHREPRQLRCQGSIGVLTQIRRSGEYRIRNGGRRAASTEPAALSPEPLLLAPTLRRLRAHAPRRSLPRDAGQPGVRRAGGRGAGSGVTDFNSLLDDVLRAGLLRASSPAVITGARRRKSGSTDVRLPDSRAGPGKGSSLGRDDGGQRTVERNAPGFFAGAQSRSGGLCVSP